MKKANLADADCPVARALEIVGDWWSLLIVRDALTGMRRFGQFAAHLGLAKNILTDRLKKLVAHGVFHVVPASDGSAYSEYQLTQKGIDLFWVLVALRQWSDKWIEGADECSDVLVDAEHGQPVAPLQLHAADGRQLSMFEVRLQQREKVALS